MLNYKFSMLSLTGRPGFARGGNTSKEVGA